MGLFGAGKKPEEQVRDWTRELNRQKRVIDREIMQNSREEKKAILEIKRVAQKDITAAKILARQLVQTRKHITRLTAAKANINSVQLNLRQNLAMIKVGGVIAKSTEVMKKMNALCNAPKVMSSMQGMQREMMKAGLIEETMNETLDDVLGDVEEEETDETITQIINEVVKGRMKEISKPVVDELPGPSEVESDEEVVTDDLQRRLESLKS